MKPHAFHIFILAFACIALPCRADDLTPEQLETLKTRLEALKENLSSHLTTRNTTAGQRFLSASADPKAAVELYLNCVKMVDYDRTGRPESDFRAWKDAQSARLKDAKFIEALQIQLRYLALSCQAAETEDKSAIFGPLTAHVDGLSRLSETPTGTLTQSVASSVFAKAYQLENLLGKNDNWEPVPSNISGIYTRVILPYLRNENPGALMNAWDKRIEQQTRFVMMIEEQKAKELRGLSRDEERRTRGTQVNQGGVLKEHAKDEFTNRTLPQLQWGKLKDMFTYVDPLNGAKAMLDFVEANLTHELGEQFYADFEGLIEAAAARNAGNKAATVGESN